MLSTGVTGGAGKARHELAGREFRVQGVLQLAAVTDRSAGYNRKKPKLSTIVAGRVCSGPVPARSSQPSGDSTIADSPDA